MFVLTCPDCGHKAKVRHARMGASSMCMACQRKYKLTKDTMRSDAVHRLKQAAKAPAENRAIEQNSETNILRARIDAFDEKSRQGDSDVVLEPVGKDEPAKTKALPMLKTRRQKGLFGFVQSVFNLL